MRELENKTSSCLPETGVETWTDSDCMGDVEEFSRDYSKLLLVKWAGDIDTAYYDGERKHFVNHNIGILDNVTEWEYLK